jgi:hypothetical protein
MWWLIEIGCGGSFGGNVVAHRRCGGSKGCGGTRRIGGSQEL